MSQRSRCNSVMPTPEEIPMPTPTVPAAPRVLSLKDVLDRVPISRTTL